MEDFDPLINLESDSAFSKSAKEIEVNKVPLETVYKDPSLPRPSMRLSYSSIELFLTCERKYELLRERDSSLVAEPDTEKNNINLDFGKALGIGTQHFAVTGNLDEAIFLTLYSFNYAFETKSKNQISLINGVVQFAKSWEDGDWEVARLDNKPASELSFKIVIDEDTGDYYCGFIDLVLQSKLDGTLVVDELKTTGIKHDNLQPMYANSSQATGYSVILDAINPNAASWVLNYKVFQYKYSDPRVIIHNFPFVKTQKDKLEWLMQLQVDHSRIAQCQDMDFYPRRGSSCMKWGKQCNLFGNCQLESMKALPISDSKEEPEWDYIFTLDELIEGVLANG